MFVFVFQVHAQAHALLSFWLALAIRPRPGKRQDDVLMLLEKNSSLVNSKSLFPALKTIKQTNNLRISFNATITACEKTGEWQQALHLLNLGLGGLRWLCSCLGTAPFRWFEREIKRKSINVGAVLLGSYHVCVKFGWEGGWLKVDRYQSWVVPILIYAGAHQTRPVMYGAPRTGQKARRQRRPLPCRPFALGIVSHGSTGVFIIYIYIYTCIYIYICVYVHVPCWVIGTSMFA